VKVLHGTPEFMAPEVVAFEPVSFSTDMWSVGVICYILLSGESPFQGDTDMETLSNVTAAQWDFEEETFSEISQQAKDFISQLLQKDPRRRLPSAGALLHPWLQHPQPSSSKVLSKERIRQFLARRKWQKTGKALLALKRL
ncbi:MYLK protein, partial [Cnemophilus loriae]|nr:MYLK protein [Cnemophilus loriae]